MVPTQDYMRRSEEVADRILDKSRQLLAISLGKKLRNAKPRSQATPAVKSHVRGTIDGGGHKSRSPRKNDRHIVDPRLFNQDSEEKGDIDFNLLDPNVYRY